MFRRGYLSGIYLVLGEPLDEINTQMSTFSNKHRHQATPREIRLFKLGLKRSLLHTAPLLAY